MAKIDITKTELVSTTRTERAARCRASACRFRSSRPSTKAAPLEKRRKPRVLVCSTRINHPDWVVVQRTPEGEVNWIIETKDREWEGTGAKDLAAREWCKRVSDATGKTWRYNRVNQSTFDRAAQETCRPARQRLNTKAAGPCQPSRVPSLR